MKTSVESFIQSENIKNFKKRLEAPTDHAQRRVLLRLLAEEKAKAEPFSGGEAETADLGSSRSAPKMSDDVKIACCNHCKRPLSEIDSGGEHLTGCSTCNLWATADSKRWKRLCEEDLRALHLLIRYGQPR
jgi:hypothetical protein